MVTKFGVKISQYGYELQQIHNICSTAENSGFESFWIADHMYSWGRKPTRDIAFECWTLLSSLAERTKRIRLGTLVVCNLFRHPAVLAKISSSFDVISGGRLNLGIGACGPSTPAEIGGFGMDFPRRAERLERLEEALKILKLMWTEDSEIKFAGHYYKLSNVLNFPKPIQKPYPPIVIGGEREDILALTAKYANIWNCRRLSLDEFRTKVANLNSLCESNGRRNNDLEKSWQGAILISRNDQELEEKMKKYPLERGAIFGTPDKVIEQIQRYVSEGASRFMLIFQDDTELKSIELFAREVIPQFSKL